MLTEVFLAILSAAYCREQIDEKRTRTVLRLKPHLAPIKVAVIPLLKNKPDLVNAATLIKARLQKLGLGRVVLENCGNVGKAYRRHDEVGTPLCVTVDFETLETPGASITVRDRDSMSQHRIDGADLSSYVREFFAQ